MKLRALAFLWMLLLVPAAAGAFTGTASAAGEKEILQRGADLYRAGQTEEALSRLRGFVLRHGASPLLPEAYLFLSRILLETGRPAEALAYLDRVPPDQHVSERRLLAGAAHIGNGNAEDGIELLLDVEPEDLAAADRQVWHAALAEGNAGLGRPLSALYYLQEALNLPMEDGERERLQQQVHLLLRDRLGDSDLAEAAFMFAGTSVGEDARLQMALRAFSRGEFGQARRLAEAVVVSGISFPFRQDAMLLVERLSGQSWSDRSIGVLLPLSGRFAAFGQLVRRGMELAAQVHNDSAVRLLFVDTGADPERAAAAVSSLVKEQRVMAIAGPLTGAAATAASQRAQEEQVPMLALSQKDGLPETGDYVFRDSLTARLQVGALVRFAMEEKGITDFGILFPESRGGEEMAELFAREVEGRQGRVVVQQRYGEADTDFRVQIRRLQGRDPNASEEEPGKPGEPLLPPEPAPFQALFIPDRAERVGLIVPQLEFYGLHDIQLLGTNGWNSPELFRMAGPSLDGAIFVDGFFRYSPHPIVEEFVNLHFEKYGEEPSLLEAQGFDAAGILIQLLADPGIHTRADLRNALTGLSNYPGVTGATTFGQNGEAEKILFILEVQNGNVVHVN